MTDLTPSRSIHPYPVPANDAGRRAMIDALDLQSRTGDPFLAEVVAMTRRAFDVPVAFVSMISGDTQRFLCVDGIDLDGTPRSHSLCAYTIAAKAPIAAPDTLADSRFRDHPIVIRPPHLRFYAGAPVILSNGICTGTVCAVDLMPRDMPTPAQMAQLVSLAAMVARFCEQPILPDAMAVAASRAAMDAARQTFLDLIGHELRTPLNGILGLSSCLSPADTGEEEIVTALQGAAIHLDAVIGSVLSFTELSSGDIRLDESALRLDDLVRGAVADLQGLARARDRSLTFDPGTGPVAMRADAAKLGLAVACLLDNVIAHGGVRSRVGLHRTDGGGIVVRVSDDGHGIDEARVDAIWTAFAVGADVHRRAADGLGLGLTLTRRIAELHGGAVTVRNTATGFEADLTLPAWRLLPDMPQGAA